MSTAALVSASRVPSLAVLDTNVVLDLWLFRDARLHPLRAAFDRGAMQALATASMGAELADVLARPFVQGWNVAPAAVFDAWRGCVQLVEAPAGQSPWPPRCSDGDDQKFIDLAWHGSAAWLFSRDRAVLKLARAARLRGLRIATPETWLDAVQA